MKKYKYYIGIDPGVNTGVCLWSRSERKIKFLSSMMIHLAMEYVKQTLNAFPGEVFVKVEDARKATFGRQNDYFKAQGAGSVKRDAKIWEDFLTDIKAPHEMVRPNNKLTKLPADRFKMITGYEGKTNGHGRDAAMIVVGM